MKILIIVIIINTILEFTMEKLNSKLYLLERIYRETNLGKEYIYPSIVKMIASNLNISDEEFDKIINDCSNSGLLNSFENLTGNQCIQITQMGIDYVNANSQ